MTMDLRRSTHPDLLDELEPSLSPPEPSPSASNGTSSRARSRRRAADVPAASPPGEPETPVAAEGGSDDGPPPSEPVLAESQPEAPDVPEWLASARASDDPREMLRLLVKNVPRDQMEQDDTLRGWLGEYANTRARKMLEDQDRQRAERERAAAYERGDLYALGQLSAADLQAQRQLAEQQAQAALNPYMQGISRWQSTLPEAVQREIQGRNYDTFEAYLQAAYESATRHGLAEEVRKREPALRKAELSSTVGGEMTPELDAGPAREGSREITGAQVGAMSLEEYMQRFDEKGRPKPGWDYVQTERDIDVRREQRR